MAVTLTYDATLSRVQITATALAAADTALVERSTDQLQWTTVRGGAAVAVTAGVFAQTLDDYEFTPGVINYYRVSGVEAGPITFVGVGTTATGNNASITPTLPAGLLAGDLLVTLASIRNSGVGTVNTPTGWTNIATTGNLTFLARRYVAGDVAPLVTFAGGVANADTLGRMIALRRAELTPLSVATQLNGSAQDMAYPALNPSQDGCVILRAGWKQGSWTSVATLPGATEVGEQFSTAGDDASQVWDYVIQTTATDIAAGSFIVTGGAAQISRAITLAIRHADFLNQQSANITPVLDQIWLKSIARPFLNQTVTVINPSRIVVNRPARVGIFDVVGRSLPIAVSDVRSSRRWTMLVRTLAAAATADLEFLLASGDVVLIHTPPGCSVPHGYVAFGDAVEETHPLRPLRVTTTLPCTEVAPPGPDVIGSTVTWQSVLNAYPTWADVIAANLTWGSLLTLIGDPSEVIVA